MTLLTTAGDGTWILATERGLIWLAKWQRTTPSISAAPMSSGRITFNLDSRFYKDMRINVQVISKCMAYIHITNYMIKIWKSIRKQNHYMNLWNEIYFCKAAVQGQHDLHCEAAVSVHALPVNAPSFFSLWTLDLLPHILAEMHD